MYWAFTNRNKFVNPQIYHRIPFRVLKEPQNQLHQWNAL
jgi:hypothetical protein